MASGDARVACAARALRSQMMSKGLTGNKAMNQSIMRFKNLEEALNAAGGAVSLLRSSLIGRYVFPVVPAEFTNWRDEQQAWRNTCALMDLSYHMTDLYLKGETSWRYSQRLGATDSVRFRSIAPSKS